MRLLLKRGKLRELLKKERNYRKLSWNEFARFLKIKPRKLKSLFYEEVLIEKSVFSRLHLSKEFITFKIKELNDNWGKRKGAQKSAGRIKEIKIPQRDENLAEFFGILLGDGNLYKNEKQGVYQLTITGNSETDKKYLVSYVKNLLEWIFGIKARARFLKKQKGIQIIADSRKIIDFFENEGFKAGDKIKNKVGIPKWIKEDEEFLKKCLRGLYDTDGCIYKLTNQNSHQISFSNRNQKLLDEVREALMLLGIFPSKITKGKEIDITKKSELIKFIKLIGFHNPKHLNKVKMWRIAPSSSGQILQS